VSCAEEHCITCGDEAIPMRVMRPEPDGQATCEDGVGTLHLIAVDLVEPVARGEELLVHAGVAIGRR